MFPCVSCSPPPKVRDPISDGDGDTQSGFFPSGKHSIHELHDAPSLSIRRDFMHVVLHIHTILHRLLLPREGTYTTNVRI